MDQSSRIGSSGIDRRRFLQAGGLSLAAAAALAGPAAAYTGGRRRRGTLTRNVIFAVSDGMSTGTLTLADMACRASSGKRCRWIEMLQTPGARRSLAMTHSADSLVTDSAAGGCAWAVGAHVNNGSINVTPDNNGLSPILVRAMDRGLAGGLVTTTEITHATPASFVATVESRSQGERIGRQMLERGTHVCLGGGARHFPEELLAEHEDMRVVRTAEELAAAPVLGRVLGVLRGHMPYQLDRQADHPSLEIMTRAALDRLEPHPEGFVLQVEGGRVDHAAHGNDAGALLADQLEFDRTLGLLIDFTLGRDDTLLIVTTDHGNANPGLTLYGEEGNRGFERLSGATMSFERFWRLARDNEENIGGLIAEMTGGYELDAASLDFLKAGVIRGERTDGFMQRANDAGCLLGSVLANYTGVSFLSPNHTADLVEVAAIGPGAELLEPVIDNTDLHEIMVRALALSRPEPAAVPAG